VDKKILLMELKILYWELRMMSVVKEIGFLVRTIKDMLIELWFWMNGR